jgi:oligoendopeptidase F
MTAPKAIPPRSEIAHEHTWNAESVYADRAAWQAELKAIEAELPKLAPYQGRLSESAAVLAEWFELSEALARRVSTLAFYAFMSQACNSTDDEAVSMAGAAGSVASRYGATVSFEQPELLAMGEVRLNEWAAAEPKLAIYKHAFHDLFRQQAHVRSAEVEEVLAMASEPFGAVDNTENMLTSADLQFNPIVTAESSTPLVQGNIWTFMESQDRDLRRQAWENYQDGYLAMKNTLASNYIASVKRDVFYARARRYPSSLEASLFRNNIPRAVFDNLIATYRKNIPTWHKYWAIRRKALGVEALNPYDIWAPITQKPPVVPFKQAVDWICEGLSPLGADYVNALRQGCLEDRWVDIYPNQGKSSGAFSYGAYDTHPFIMMSYDDNLGAMSTLSHELGHSMHSYLTRKNQPYAYGNYTLFVAEVASNFNQAMTRANLFRTQSDPAFQIGLIEEAMSNLHRYFFIMPTLARFETDVHERVERGQGVTAADLNGLMADLFSEGYGSEMVVDRDRVGITWSQFGHLYSNFYVYQYATGISAAHALAGRILDGVPNAAADYVRFLSAGSSLYPVDALKVAGVDMATPEAVERTFAVLAEYVERLDKLTGG